jgi:chloride channel protein, CIC family
MPAALLGGEFLRTGRHGFAVVNPDGSLFGVVSLEDYRNLTTSQEVVPETLRVGDIATRELVTVFPDDAVGVALRRMAPRDLSRLPVVSPQDASRLVGVVRRNDIVRAYEVGVVRREEARRRADTVHTVRTSQAEFLDIVITVHSAAAGKTVAKSKLPRTAVLVSIRRGDELIIPHGDTYLMPGDVVTALCERAHASKIRKALS